MGSIFYSVLAVTLLPFASLSLFIYDRQFYSGEAASKLYTSRHGVWRVETCVDICLCWWYRYGCVCVRAHVRTAPYVNPTHIKPITQPHHPTPHTNSAYFLANIVLETALNSLNGLLYSLIVYFNLDYATFTRPESVAANFMVRVPL